MMFQAWKLPLDLVLLILDFIIIKDDHPRPTPNQQPVSPMSPATSIDVDSSEGNDYETDEDEMEDEQEEEEEQEEDIHGQTTGNLQLALIDEYRPVAAFLGSSHKMRELLVNEHDTFWNWLVQSLSGDAQLAVAVSLRWFPKPFCEARHLMSDAGRAVETSAPINQVDADKVYLACVVLRNDALMTRSMLQSFSEANVVTIVNACMETSVFELAVERNCKESTFTVLRYVEDILPSCFAPETTEQVRRTLKELYLIGKITLHERIALGGLYDDLKWELLHRLARVACVSGNESMMRMLLEYGLRARKRRDFTHPSENRGTYLYDVNSMSRKMYISVHDSIMTWNEEGQKAARSSRVVEACLHQGIDESDVREVLVKRTFPLPAHKRPAYHHVAIKRGYLTVVDLLYKCIKRLARLPRVIPEIEDILMRAIVDDEGNNIFRFKRAVNYNIEGRKNMICISQGDQAALVMYVVIRYLPDCAGKDIIRRILKFMKNDQISRSPEWQKKFRREFKRHAKCEYLVPDDLVALAILNGRRDLLRDLVTAEPNIFYPPLYSNPDKSILHLLRNDRLEQGRQICQVLLDIFREMHTLERGMQCGYKYPYVDLLRVVSYRLGDKSCSIDAPVLMCMYLEGYLTSCDISSSEMIDRCFPFLSDVCCRIDKHSRMPFLLSKVAMYEKENVQGQMPLLQRILEDPHIPVDEVVPSYDDNSNDNRMEHDTVLSCCMRHRLKNEKGLRMLLQCPRIDCSVRLNIIGETMLHKLTPCTAYMGFAVLEEKGADGVEAFKIKDTDGRSVLMSLASQSQRVGSCDQDDYYYHLFTYTKALLRALIFDKRCVGLNDKDNKGRTALVHAARNGNFAFANMLFEIIDENDGIDGSIRMDVSTATTFDTEDTPLHAAVKYLAEDIMNDYSRMEMEEIVRFFEWLIPAVGPEGLNVHNRIGQTPLSIALMIPLKSSFDHYTNRIVRLFLQHGATQV